MINLVFLKTFYGIVTYPSFGISRINEDRDSTTMYLSYGYSRTNEKREKIPCFSSLSSVGMSSASFSFCASDNHVI